MSARAVYQRVGRYLKKGVPLKNLPAFEDWKWLAQYAEDLKTSAKRR
jgi:hypothetical protein